MVEPTMDPVVWLPKQLEEADVDLLREMVATFIQTLMSAEADAVCGAPYGERSSERVNRRNAARNSRRYPSRVGRARVRYGVLVAVVALTAVPAVSLATTPPFTSNGRRFPTKGPAPFRGTTLPDVQAAEALLGVHIPRPHAAVANDRRAWSVVVNRRNRDVAITYTHGRGLEDLVGPAELSVLALERLQLLALLRGEAGSRAAVDLAAADPLAQRLGGDAELAGDRGDRGPLRGVLLLVLELHPDCPLADLLRVPAASCHGSNLSRVGASEKPGTVQCGTRGSLSVIRTLPTGSARRTGIAGGRARHVLQVGRGGGREVEKSQRPGGQGVQDVGRLVHPVPLVPGLGEYVAGRGPEPQSPIAHRQDGGPHPPATAVSEQLRPALGGLPVPVGDGHELELPPPPPGRPGIFALADAGALAQLIADAGFRDVETGTVTAIYETASPGNFTQWTRDVAPPIVNLLKGHPVEVQERVWRKVTEAWSPLVTSEGRVRTENQAIWVAATK